MKDVMDRIARFFDADYAGFTEDLPLFQAYAERTGGPILELGCGTGRLIVPLAEAGYAVTGIETSPAMLAIAEEKLGRAGLTGRATLICADFAETDPSGASPLASGAFPLAISAMNTFMHLATQAAQMSALRQWHRHLAPGGLLILDLFNPDVAELASLDGGMELEKVWKEEESGRTVMKQLSRTLSLLDQIIHLTIAYDSIAIDGQVARTLASFDMRYLWPSEARLLLDKAGYGVEAVYGDWDFSELCDDSPRLIIVARRRR